MTIDSNISIKDILKIIDKKLEQKEKIQDIIAYCEQGVLDLPNNQQLKNKLEYLHDLSQSEDYISEENGTLDERVELEEEFKKIAKLESKDEILTAYKKLETKYPGHKGIQAGINQYIDQQGSSSRSDMAQTFREIAQLKGPWGEPDYELQKKKLLELQEKFPFHEGIKEGLSSLEEGQKNNFREN